MRPRVNNSAVLQRRQAQMRAAAAAAAAANHRGDHPHHHHSSDPPGPGCPGVPGVVSSTHASSSAPTLFFAKYFPLPDLPADGQFTFELILFAYAMVSMCLQHLHLYRSVFWLQHSYNNSGMNWYLIDWNLLLFAVLILGRRILWLILRTLITYTTPAYWTQSFVVVARSLTTMLVLGSVFVLAYAIVQQHKVVNLLYLAYPVSLYFLLFGFAGEPFMELIPNTTCGKMRLYQDKSGLYRTTYLLPGMSPLAENVRNEVSMMKTDFNMRVKQAAFNSVCTAYYTAFIPCAFASGALYYEFFWVLRHGILVWIGCVTLYAVQLFPANYVHMMHRTANHLGQWTKITGRVSPNFYPLWAGSSFCSRGTIVRLGKDLYRTDTFSNAAEPGNKTQFRFYYLFSNVSLFSLILAILQTSLILAQHASLVYSTQWYQIISEALLLFVNYYAFFKCVRDYRVFARVHKAEEGMFQEQETSSS